MSTVNTRTTAGLLGDFLASQPAGQTFAPADLATKLKRDRSGINAAIASLSKALAIVSEQDVNDRRRNIVHMTSEQGRAWRTDAGASIAAAAGINLEPLPMDVRASKQTREAAQEKRPGLRFGMWSDGALVIEGLARKQLTVPAGDTGALALLFSSFPEGALQALCDSPLKPAFSLSLEGREHPMTSAQTAELITYIEQLPARAIRGVQRHGADHRVHRIETPEDRLPAEV